MTDCLFFLSSIIHKPNQIVAMAANKCEKVNYNSSIPYLLQKKENIPLVYSFPTLDIATTFSNHRLYDQPILQIKSNPSVNEMKITYQLKNNDLSLLQTNIEDLYLYEQDIISDFVLQTQAAFLVIDDLNIDEHIGEVHIHATVIDPIEEVTLGFEFQTEINRHLETNFLL